MVLELVPELLGKSDGLGVFHSSSFSAVTSRAIVQKVHEHSPSITFHKDIFRRHHFIDSMPFKTQYKGSLLFFPASVKKHLTYIRQAGREKQRSNTEGWRGGF